MLMWKYSGSRPVSYTHLDVYKRQLLFQFGFDKSLVGNNHILECLVDLNNLEFHSFANEYIVVAEMCIRDRGVHHPFHKSPRVTTMLFTPLISMVGVTGSMGPFCCEFTLNGDLLPPQYPATDAHELAHFLGITSEAEANFYAYQVLSLIHI